MAHFFTRNVLFFDLLDELAAYVPSCAGHLRTFAVGFPLSQSEIECIHEEEHKADEIGHRVLERLNHAFLPPIDSEDVHALTNALDDVIDDIDAVAKHFPLYHIEAMEPLFLSQTEVLVV